MALRAQKPILLVRAKRCAQRLPASDRPSSSVVYCTRGCSIRAGPQWSAAPASGGAPSISGAGRRHVARGRGEGASALPRVVQERRHRARRRGQRRFARAATLRPRARGATASEAAVVAFSSPPSFFSTSHPVRPPPPLPDSFLGSRDQDIRGRDARRWRRRRPAALRRVRPPSDRPRRRPRRLDPQGVLPRARTCSCAAALLLDARAAASENIAIMHERALGERSRWAEYFAVLPAAASAAYRCFGRRNRGADSAARIFSLTSSRTTAPSRRISRSTSSEGCA